MDKGEKVEKREDVRLVVEANPFSFSFFFRKYFTFLREL